MSKLFSQSIFLNVLFFLISIDFSHSGPISNDLLEHFVKDLISNECSLPNQIQLPLNNTSPNLQDIFAYLKICQNFTAARHRTEAFILCEEILDNLKNLSCSKVSSTLPEIKIAFSEHVCEDINALHTVQGKDKSILMRLTDKMTCDIMCEDVFQNACQVLLWTHNVKTSIADFENSKKLEQNLLTDNAIPEADDNHPDAVLSKNPTQPELKTGSNVETQANEIDVSEKNEKIQPGSTATLDATLPNNRKNDSSTVEENKDPQDLVPAVVTGDLKSSNENLESIIISQHSNQMSFSGSKTSTANTANTQVVKETIALAVENKTLSPNVSSNQNAEAKIPATKVQENSEVKVGDEQINKSENSNEKIPTNKANDDEQGNLEGNVGNDAKDHNPHLKTNQIESTAGDAATNVQPQSITPNKPATVNKELGTTQTAQQPSNIPAKNENQKIGNLPTAKESQTQKVTAQNEATSFPEVASVEPESSVGLAATAVTVALETMDEETDIHQPSNKDTEQYNLENNEGDEEEYSRRDYEDDGFYEQTKTKDSNPSAFHPVTIPKAIVDEDEKTYGDEFPARREPFDRRPGGDIALITGFPEQEDSHFFFYFLSIVLILMAGYILFHNKQKIIALIVEGRHERRRRSHGVGYKKLETK